MAQRIRPAGRDLALLGALLPVDDDAGVRVGAGAARASPTGSATLLACAFMAVGGGSPSACGEGGRRPVSKDFSSSSRGSCQNNMTARARVALAY